MTAIGVGDLCEKFGVDWDKSALNFLMNDLDLHKQPALFIAGGSLVRLLCGLPSTGGDIDIYRNHKEIPEEFEHRIKEYKVEDGKFASKYKYQTGINTFWLNLVDKMAARPPISVLKSFDLYHCQFALFDEKIIYTDDALIHLTTRKQKLNNESKNIRFRATAHRINKYQKLGFDGFDAMEDLLINYYKNDDKEVEDSWGDESKEITIPWSDVLKETSLTLGEPTTSALKKESELEAMTRCIKEILKVDSISFLADPAADD